MQQIPQAMAAKRQTVKVNLYEYMSVLAFEDSSDRLERFDDDLSYDEEEEEREPRALRGEFVERVHS